MTLQLKNTLLLLLLASSWVGGFRTHPDASPFVVFSSFPSFSHQGGGGGGGGSHTTTSHDAVPPIAGGFNEGSGHVGSSSSSDGVPLSISEVNALGNEGDITVPPDDGMFSFSTPTSDNQDPTTPTAEERFTVTDGPTKAAGGTVTFPEAVTTPIPLTLSTQVQEKSQVETTTRASGVTKRHELRVAADPAEDPRTPTSAGSLASRLRRLSSTPRHNTRQAQVRQKEEGNVSRQMTLAQRLKALQARRNERVGSLARQTQSHLERKNIAPVNTERPLERRRGESTARVQNVERVERRQEVKVLDQVGQEGSIVETGLPVQVVQVTPAVLQTTSKPPPSPQTNLEADNSRLSYSQRLRARLQKIRERRLNLNQRTPNPPPNNVVRPQPPPKPKPDVDTQRGQSSKSTTTTTLSPSQRRRQNIFSRLRNRNSTPRSPVNPNPSDLQNKAPVTASKTPPRRVPSRRLSFLPTTPKPLSLREKILRLRNGNRFIPANKRNQITTTTISTTTTTPATTSASTTSQPPITTPPPTTPPTTTQPSTTTITTTPSLSFTTLPVTQESDDDNSLFTLPSTTEASDDSRRLQIRQMIDAMLKSKGRSGITTTTTTTTTEQIISFLEEATTTPTTFSHRATARSKAGHSPVFDDLLTTITEPSFVLPPTTRPSSTRPRDRPNLFQHFPSLADKIAASHPPKKSRFHPSPPPPPPPPPVNTPPTVTVEDDFETSQRRFTTLSELLAGGGDKRGTPSLPHRTTEGTNNERTTITSEIETTTAFYEELSTIPVDMDEILSTTQVPLEETTTEDQRVRDLITKLLSQGVITMRAPDKSDFVTPSTEDIQSTTSLDFQSELEQTQETSEEFTTTTVPDSEKTETLDTDVLRPRPTFVISPSQFEVPQLTRGAPPTRTHLKSTVSFSDTPLVFSDDIMETTVKDTFSDTHVTEVAPITTSEDTIIQTTSPPRVQPEDSTLAITEDLEENEIDAFDSKGNLQSLMRGLDHTAVRPELAAVNQVLGFSLTINDVPDLAEVNLEKPQATPDEDAFHDDAGIAATEQIMITTRLFQDEDSTPTPVNLDVTTFSILESPSDIQSDLKTTTPTAKTQSSPTTPAPLPDGEDMSSSTKAPGPIGDSEADVMETTTTKSHQSTSESPERLPSPILKDTAHQPSDDLTIINTSTQQSTPAVDNDALIPITNAPEHHEDDNVTVFVQQPSIVNISDKADDDSVRASQGVSNAVLRERLHLLKLVKERDGSTPALDTITDQPATTSLKTTKRFRLSELLKKTSGEITQPEVTTKPFSTTLKPKENTITTEFNDSHSTPTTATGKQKDTEETSKKDKIRDAAMRRFLELNKHLLHALKAKSKVPSSTEDPATPTSSISTKSTSTLNIVSESEAPTLDNQKTSPVISEVIPQSHTTHSDIAEETSERRKETKHKPSFLLRPALLGPQRNEPPTTISPDANRLPPSASDGTTSDSVTPTTPSRIAPPFRESHPHPSTKFSLTRHQVEQRGPPLLTRPSESTVESPKQIRPTTFRPPFRPLIITGVGDTSTMDKTANEPSKNETLDMRITGNEDVTTERPNDDTFTTLASLLKRKNLSSTKSQLDKQKTTALPKTTTTASTSPPTIQPDQDTFPPFVPFDHEETTINPQLSEEGRITLVPKGEHGLVRVTDNPHVSDPVRGTFTGTEGFTTGHAAPPLNLLDTNANFRTRLQGPPNGAFIPSVPSINPNVGVPLPLPGFGVANPFFPTTTPAITFESTLIPSGFPHTESPNDLSASTITGSPSHFPTNPAVINIETSTVSPPQFSLDLDTNAPPLGFNFPPHRNPINPGEGTFTTVIHQGNPLPTGFFTTTPQTSFTSFTFGQQDSFFSDDKFTRTTFSLPVTESPVATTPVTTTTPRLVPLTLPPIDDSVVSGGLPQESETTSTVISHDDTERFMPPTTTTGSTLATIKQNNIESLIPHPDVTAKAPSHLDHQQPLDSLSFTSHTIPTNIQAEQNPPERILKTNDEEFPARILSESFFENTNERNFQDEGTQSQNQEAPGPMSEPTLHGGHLNLNEVQQRHLGGQVTVEVHQNFKIPSGVQEDQTNPQVIQGQQGFQAEQRVEGQHIHHAAENHFRGQKVGSDQHGVVQHIAGDGSDKLDQQQQDVTTANQHSTQVLQSHSDGQTLSGQHNSDDQHFLNPVLTNEEINHQLVVEQRKGPVDHLSLNQGHTEGEQLNVMNHKFVESDAVPGDSITGSHHHSTNEHVTTNQHSILDQNVIVQDQDVAQEHVVNVHSIQQERQGAVIQHNVNHRKPKQEQGISSQQHSEQSHQHHLNQHNIQDQQNQHNPEVHIQGQNTHDQHHNQQEEIVQDRNKFEEVHIQGQNIQGQQHSHQEESVQDQNTFGEVHIQGQTTQGQHHNHQEESVQDQNKFEEVTQKQQNQEAEIIRIKLRPQNELNTQGQTNEDHSISHDSHQPQGEIIPIQLNPNSQQNLQGHIILGPHNGQNEGSTQTQDNNGHSQQNLEGQLNHQTMIGQTQHDSLAEEIQAQHTPQTQTPDTQERQESTSQTQQDTQGGHTASGQQQHHFQTDVNQGQDGLIPGHVNPTDNTQSFTVTQEQEHSGHDSLIPGHVIPTDNTQSFTVTHGQEQSEHHGRVRTTDRSRHQPQQNSRRGKFISGDEFPGFQRVVKDERGSRDRIVVQDVHGSGVTIVRGQSVVPPKQTRPQEPKRHRQQHTRPHQRFTSEGNRPGPPKSTPTPRPPIGHFRQSAAGFLLGPADAFITGFGSSRGELPTGGNEEEFATVLPPRTKESRARVPLSQDPDGDEIPGQAGVDYPDQTTIPVTPFTCTPEMKNMMFADPDTDCQVYHVCSGRQKYSFLCPRGTLFNQDTSVCQWWFTVDCGSQARRLNEVRARFAG